MTQDAPGDAEDGRPQAGGGDPPAGATSPYRPEFVAGLRLLARISAAMDSAGFRPPIIVGGAAVEIYTTGAVTTGDFDLSCGRQDMLETLMVEHGFVRPSGPGMATRGWIHPALRLGFEVVSDTLLDGMADRTMVRLVEVLPEGTVGVIAPEDIIADRMGQYASGSAPEMLGQAQTLYRLCDALDLDYMERRIAEETFGNHGVQDLADDA